MLKFAIKRINTGNTLSKTAKRSFAASGMDGQAASAAHQSSGATK
jgi:hypothetical protein